MNENQSIQHVAIICDGNRTWARERGMDPMQGHLVGMKKGTPLLEMAVEMKIPVLSLWIMGVDNFKRSKEEVDWLMKIFEDAFNEWHNKAKEFNIKFRLCGFRGEPAPQYMIALAEKLEEKSKNNTGTIMNICFNYGGHLELIEAFKKISEQGLEINEENITNNLWTAGLPNPDLIIRPGKQQRLSGFMPWQSEYSEFYFPKYYFPEMGGEELKEAVDEFYKRTRKFGKI